MNGSLLSRVLGDSEVAETDPVLLKISNIFFSSGSLNRFEIPLFEGVKLMRSSSGVLIALAGDDALD